MRLLQELAQKIKGYQEQISALNSKCKMLTVKAKHATMLLMVSEVDGLSDGLEELEDEEEEMPKHPPAHPSVVMVSDLHTYTWLWGALGALSCVCLCILCHELSFFLVLSVDNHPMGLLFLPQGFLHQCALTLTPKETG